MLQQVGSTQPIVATPETVRPTHKTASSINGQLVYAIGDVHGRYDLLRDLLRQISADAADSANERRPVLILCGDYVDRGPDSAKVLDALVWLRRHNAFDLHLLKGNHDQMLLAFLENPDQLAQWFRRYGKLTLDSYGVEAVPELDSIDLILARDRLLDAMPASHLELLRSLKLIVSVGDYAFVHAGVQPGVALESQTEEDLLWIKDEFLNDSGPFPKVIVHGHSWTDDKPRLLSYRIGIDTGAYHTGVLTAVRLEDQTVTVMQSLLRT